MSNVTDIELQPSGGPSPKIENKYEVVKELPKDNQDLNQKIGVTIAVIVEIYRALIASFLICFLSADALSCFFEFSSINSRSSFAFPSSY